MLPSAYGGHWNKRSNSQNVPMSPTGWHAYGMNSAGSGMVRYWALVHNIKAVVCSLSSPVCISYCLVLSAAPDIRFLRYTRTPFCFLPNVASRLFLSSYVFVSSLPQDVSASRPHVTSDVASALYNSTCEIPTYVDRQRTFLQFLCWFVWTAPSYIWLHCRI
jgi:hypothetical protein